jgi:excisionase family DNA binding protein
MECNNTEPSLMNNSPSSTVDWTSSVDTLNGITGARSNADAAPNSIPVVGRQDRLLALLEGEPPRARSKKETPLPEAEMLTKPQAAALLTLSVRTLDRLVARGDIPHVRLGKRCVRFPLKVLKNWIESKTKFRK